MIFELYFLAWFMFDFSFLSLVYGTCAIKSKSRAKPVDCRPITTHYQIFSLEDCNRLRARIYLFATQTSIIVSCDLERCALALINRHLRHLFNQKDWLKVVHIQKRKDTPVSGRNVHLYHPVFARY